MITSGVVTVSSGETVKCLSDCISWEPVDLLVVGFPKQISNEPSEGMEYVEAFMTHLERTILSIPVIYYDERSTSISAHEATLEGNLKKKKRQDKGLAGEISAVVILQAYLESKKYQLQLIILPVFLYDQPVLRKEAEDIPKDYPNLEQLVANIFGTMYNADGVGLVAPQVGLSICLVVVDGDVMGNGFPECKGSKRALTNPEFLERSEEEMVMGEGCLSLSDIHEKMSRSKTVRAGYQDENWEKHGEVVEDFAARIAQYEYERLMRYVFVSNVSAIRRQLSEGELDSIIKGTVRCSYQAKAVDKQQIYK